MINRKVILVLAACVFPLAAGEIPEKAERYHTMLLRKPENPVLFGRMLDAWLEERELEALEPELEERAKAGGAADWRLLAVFHEHSGDEDAAIRALDEAVKLAPDDAAARLARGKALGAALRFDAALEDLAVAAADKALQVEAGTLRGKLLARAGRPAEAVKAWQELIAANPADEGLKEDLIELEIGEGMLEEAIAAARELADKTEDPYKKALRRLQVAEILAQAAKKDEALAEFRGVFAVSADGSWLEREVLARAGALFSREDDSEGLKEFLSALREEQPRRVAVKKELAKALLATGQEEEAIAMFREVIKVMPGDREVREEFIGLLEGAERFKDAAEEMAALLEQAGDDAALWERQAVLKQQLKDDAGLRQALDRALALMPEDEGGRVARARLLERFGKLDEAEQQLREAVAAHGLAGESGEALAAFLVAREKGDEALALWKDMAAGADRDGLLRIVRSLTAHGKAAEAYALLQPRMKDFPEDAMLLAALCQAAQLTDEAEAAIPQAMALVRLAGSPTDLESALRLAGALISRAEEPKKWLDQLAAKPDLTLPERCLLAEVHETLGDSIAAEKVLKEAMAGDESLLAATQRVRLHEIRGDMDAAVAAMREMMALPGGMKTAHIKKLVELHERAGAWDEALRATDEWLKLAPGDRVAWIKRSDLFLGEGRPIDAVAELRRALAKFGGDEELRSKLADAQREAGMMDEAWRNFTALHDEAESPASKLKWAAALARMAAMEGKEEELIQDFRRRARDNPSSPLPLLALADMYREWQLPDEELKCVAEASRRKPDDGALKFRMADLEEQAGNGDASAAILRGLLGGPDAAEARRRLSAYWIRQGDVERGLRELAEGGKSVDPRTSEKLVMPLARTKEWEAACEVLARETAAHPDDWRLAYFHAFALLQADRSAEAVDRFAALLEADGELAHPVATPPPNRGYPMGYPGMTRPGKPAVVTRKVMPEFPRYQNQVLSFRDPDRYGYYGGVPGEVPLPDSPDAVRRLALTQLILLAKEQEEMRAGIVAKIHSSHFDDLETFKRVFFLSRDELRDHLAGEQATADDLRWFVQMLNHREADEKDRDLLKAAMDRHAEADPALALFLSNWVHAEGEEAEALQRRRLELFKRLDEDARQENWGVMQALAFHSQAVPDDVRKEAEDFLIGWLEKQPGGIAGNGFSTEMAGYFLANGRFERAVEWLNRIHEEESKNPANAARNARMMASYGNPFGYRMGWGSSSQQAGYPQILQMVEGRLYSSLNRRQNGNPTLTAEQKRLLKLIGADEARGEHITEPPDTAKLAGLASQLKDPKERICIYELADKADEVEREIKAIEAAADAPADQLLIAALFRAKKSPEVSYALLLKARDAADASPWKDEIEQQIVRTGVSLAEKKTEGVDLEPAKRAALRLRRQASANPELKTQVAGWLSSLGMEEEAKRFVAAPAGFASRAARNMYGMSRSFGGMRSRSPEIVKLVKDGKRDAAARMIAAELRRIAGTPNEEYERSNLMESVKTLALEKDLTRLSQPDEGAGFNRRRDHALLLLSLDLKKEAEPWLRQLAKEKPANPQVAAALYSVLGPEERKNAAKSLAEKGFDEDVLSQFFMAQRGQDAAEQRLDGFEALTALMESLAPDYSAERNLTWVNYLTKDMATDDYMSVQLRPLFRQPGEGNQYHEEHSKRRAELCKRMFNAMLRHPQTAEQGFILMEGTSKALKITPEELDEAAVSAQRQVARLEALPAARQHYSRRDALWAWIRGNGSSSSGGPPAGLSPSAWIASRRGPERKLEPFDDDFLAELAKGDLKESLEAARAVVEGKGVEAFEAWKKETSDDAARRVKELNWISRLAAKSGRDDLEAALVDLMCEHLRNGDSSGGDFAELVVRPMLRQKDPAGKQKALRELAVKILGPEEAWPLYAGLDENTYLPGIYQRRNAFTAVCTAASDEDAGAVAATRFSLRHGFGRFAQGSWTNLFDGTLDARRLLGSGLFAFGPEPVLPIPRSGSASQGMLDYLPQRFSGEPAEKLAAELLKADGDNRFWARLTGAILAKKPETAYAELDRVAATVTKWPAAHQAAFGAFVDRWLPEAANRTGKPMQRLLAESLRKGDADALQQAEKVLKEGPPQNFHPYSGDETVFPLIVRLIPTEPALAAKVWDRCLEHFRNVGQGWSSTSGGFSTPPDTYAHGELMDHLMEISLPLDEICAFFAEMEKLPGAAHLGGTDGNLRYYVGQRFSNEAKRRTEQVKKITVPQGFANEAGLVLALAKDLPAESRPILAGLLAVRMSQSSWGDNGDPGHRKEIEWTRAQIGKLSPAVANARIFGLLADQADRLDDAGKAELRKAFVGLIGDSSVPAWWRFTALCDAGSRNGAAIRVLDDPACGKAIADLMEAYATPARSWASQRTLSPLIEFAAGKQLAPADATRMMATVARSRIDYAGGDNTGRSAVSSLNLSLALRSGDKAAIDKAARDAGASSRGRLDLSIQLWQAGIIDSAKLLLARPGEFHSGAASLFLGMQVEEMPAFTREIESALPQWLASIDDAGQRYRVECLVSCLRDAEEEAAPAVKRIDRLSALAKRFAAEAPKPRASRMETLAALAQGDHEAFELLSEYESLTRGTDLGTLVIAMNSSPSSPSDREERAVVECLIRRHSRLSLTKNGDASVLIKQVESLQLNSGGNSEYYSREMMGRFFEYQGTLLIRRIHELEGDAKKAAAAAALELCDLLLGFRQQDIQGHVIPLGLMSQVAAGDGAAFHRWLDALPEDRRSRYDEMRKRQGLRNSFQMLAENPWKDKAHDAVRRSLLTAMLADEATSKREITHPTDLSLLVDSNAFTIEDVAAAVEALPDAHPMKSGFTAEAAGIIGWRTTDQMERVLAMYDKADELAKASGDPKAVAYAKAYRAIYFDHRLKKPADGLAVAKEIKLDDLEEKERKWMEEILKKGAEKK
jgi:predicted Zn-dependent protease